MELQISFPTLNNDADALVALSKFAGSRYRYQSFRQIRLLQFEPSKFPDLISCTLRKFDLDDTQLPPYVALSYTWGDEFPVRIIFIDEKFFTVRDNLYQFLLLHKSNTSAYFWIDQICIDQSNILERNHQVSLMTQIYSQASQVTVWLGSEADDSNSAMQAIRNHIRPTPYVHHNTQAEYLEARQEQEKLRKEGKHYDAGINEATVAIVALFDRPYWNRLWIIQEIMLARSLVVQCGSSITNWKKFEEYFNLLQTFTRLGLRDSIWPGSDYETAGVTFANFRPPVFPHNVQTILAEKAWFDDSSTFDGCLSYLITTFSHSQCWLLHDRVYGFLGLVLEDQRVEIDYTKSPREVFEDLISKVTDVEFHRGKEYHLDFAARMRSNLGLDDAKIDLDALVTEGLKKAERSGK